MTRAGASTGRIGRQPGTWRRDPGLAWATKVLSGVALRQTAGIVESLSGLDRGVPDFSTPSRRQKALKVDISCRDLLVTSAGFKIKGRGRMKRPPARRHETPRTVTRASGAPLARLASDPYRHRREAPGNPGRRVHRQHIGDAPCCRNCWSDPALAGDRQRHRRWRPRARGAVDFFAPQGPRPCRFVTTGTVARNEFLRRSKRAGRTIWRRWSTCHRRSRAVVGVHRSGSVYLNRLRAFHKWFPASVIPQPLPALAG